MDLGLDLNMDMDLDLNREPVQSQSLEGKSPAHLLVELEDSHGSIRERMRVLERMRLLESVAARSRCCHRPLQSSSNIAGRPDRIRPCKIEGGTHLLAEALAMDSSSEQNLPSTSTSPSPSGFRREPGGSVFDCNICFLVAEDPVVTCCGHLFCWPCFYCLPNSDSYYSKECPVCEGVVQESAITPIYGSGCRTSPHHSLALASSRSNDPLAVKIPPRPRARRINRTHPRLVYPHQRPPQSFGGVPPPWLAASNTLAMAGVIPPRPATEGANNAITLNSMASLYHPPSMNQPEAPVADAHSETPVTDMIDESHPTVTRRTSRRIRNGSGLALRNQRRRGDWLGR